MKAGKQSSLFMKYATNFLIITSLKNKQKKSNEFN